jgi:hypothetical protein
LRRRRIVAAGWGISVPPVRQLGPRCWTQSSSNDMRSKASAARRTNVPRRSVSGRLAEKSLGGGAAASRCDIDGEPGTVSSDCDSGLCSSRIAIGFGWPGTRGSAVVVCCLWGLGALGPLSSCSLPVPRRRSCECDGSLIASRGAVVCIWSGMNPGRIVGDCVSPSWGVCACECVCSWVCGGVAMCGVVLRCAGNGSAAFDCSRWSRLLSDASCPVMESSMMASASVQRESSSVSAKVR